MAKEYVGSHYLDVDTDAYTVWAEHNWWVLPWFDILANNGTAEAKV